MNEAAPHRRLGAKSGHAFIDVTSEKRPPAVHLGGPCATMSRRKATFEFCPR
jgi:hypothetical protein